MDAPYSVDDAALDFIRLDRAFPECDVPVYNRWIDVLTHIPEARTRSITGRYDDVYERAYKSLGTTDPYDPWSTTQLRKGAVNLAMLQTRFFETLILSRIGHRHAAEYRMEAALAWWKRLDDKLLTTMPAGFTASGQFLHEISLTPKAHRWQH
jgi:hypothetical protein